MDLRYHYSKLLISINYYYFFFNKSIYILISVNQMINIYKSILSYEYNKIVDLNKKDAD